MPCESGEKLTLTGQLGEVMKESATAALSYVRSNHKHFNIPDGFYNKSEIHVHAPEGAIPKDGPSAGTAIAIAIISAASGQKALGKVAMTGEVNLRGKVLAIGGLKEKLLAAKRVGITKVLIPTDNVKDLEEIPNDIKDQMEICPVKDINEAYNHAICISKTKKTKK